MTNKQTKKKKTKKQTSPSPAQTAHAIMIGFVSDDKTGDTWLFTLRRFHVPQTVTELFAKNLGHAHKVNEYMAAGGGHKNKKTRKLVGGANEDYGRLPLHASPGNTA